MTKYERKRLFSAQNQYLNNEYKHIVEFTIICTGFCLGTLSSSKIDPLYNLLIILVLLLIFIIKSLGELFNNKSGLRLLIKELSDKYKSKPDVMKEIKSFDIWFGWGLRTFKHTGIVTVSTLFMGYTALEHYLRLN